MHGHLIVVNRNDAIDHIWILMFLHVASESCCHIVSFVLPQPIWRELLYFAMCIV